MRQVPLEPDIAIAVNGLFLVEVASQDWVIYGMKLHSVSFLFRSLNF